MAYQPPPEDNIFCTILGTGLWIIFVIVCCIFGLIQWIFSSPLTLIGSALFIYFFVFYHPNGNAKKEEEIVDVDVEKDEIEDRTVEVRDED
jgi:hypothetical protein